MARISGVDIPREKRLEISLTYIFGVGRSSAQEICDNVGISRDTRVRDLTDEEVKALYAIPAAVRGAGVVRPRRPAAPAAAPARKRGPRGPRP